MTGPVTFYAAGNEADGGGGFAWNRTAAGDYIYTATTTISEGVAGTNAISEVVAGTNAIVQTGIISTVAGNGQWGFSGDGSPATEAQLYSPHGVFVDSTGDMYIADTVNNRIRKVDRATGIISTVAGNGPWGGFPELADLNSTVAGNGPWDGFPELADLDSLISTVAGNGPWDGFSELTDLNSLISTVAGNGPWDGFFGDGGLATGDGGPATEAWLSRPRGVFVDSTGDIYIADTVNNRIRKVAVSTGIISTVAGNGQWGFSGDGGPATEARLSRPRGKPQ